MRSLPTLTKPVRVLVDDLELAAGEIEITVNPDDNGHVPAEHVGLALRDALAGLVDQLTHTYDSTGGHMAGITHEDIAHRFAHHPPDAERAGKHTSVRAVFTTLAHEVVDLVPAGREQALAVTALEDALMWANAGIARNPGSAGGEETLPPSARPGGSAHKAPPRPGADA